MRASTVASPTFTNPIVAAVAPAGAADPSILHHDGRYHYCKSVGDRAIGLASAERLQDLRHAPMRIVWRAEAGTPWSDEVWAPELQCVDGRWYIYFAASDGDNRNHRMYALEADTPDLGGSWSFRGKIAAPTDCWAIDGIAVRHKGLLYFVWSGWRHHDAGFPQVLYIAPMSDPLTICGERCEIAAPDRDWEQVGAPLLEGPAVLYRDHRIFIAYSASASWTDDYKLGLLTYDGGDILSASSWVKSERPVFEKQPRHGVWGPGHNTFMQSPDGLEDWIVYHAIDRPGGGWPARSVRAQPFGWTVDGLPDFGAPVAPGEAVAEPSDGTRPGVAADVPATVPAAVNAAAKAEADALLAAAMAR